jgi:thymidine phosphorylase
MNEPVGRAAGNWLEVKEAQACLEGEGASDLRELVLDCAAHLLIQTRRAKTLDEARRVAEGCLNSGSPMEKWNEMIEAQGADLKSFHEKLTLTQTAPTVVELKSPKAGFVSRCDARVIGEVVRDLGGGRLTKESVINHDVGIDGLVKPGERVDRGFQLARIHAVDQKQAEAAAARLKTAIEVFAKKIRRAPLISEVITGR